MISSEVQRTLVKSPPELWAELSDPESLARHLGAFGEIRITRAEPEKLVEWEAERASGSVQIKPSGWGTKVTLSITREVELEERTEPGYEPQRDRLAEAEQSGEHDATPADPDDAAEQPAAEDGLAEREPAAEAEQPAAEEGLAEPQPAAEEEQLAEGEYPAEPEGLAEPEPAVEAEPLAGGEYPAEAAPGWEIDPRDDGVEPDAIEWPPEPEHVEESRRGFFARLFSRLRGQPASHSSPFEAETPDADDDGGPSIEAGAEPTAEPIDAEAEQTPASAIESLQARYAPLERVEEPLAEERSEAPAAEEAVEAPPEAPAAEEALETPPEASAEVDLEPSEPAPQASPDTSPEASAAVPTDAAPDLAAELAAAEEVAAEEVTAVLTEVLDRLGAAHHRPFSRS